MKQTYIFESWPNKIDFDYLENLEVEYYPAKVIYKSFFTMLNMPRVIASSLIHLLSSDTETKNKYTEGSIEVFERQFFKVFDDAYSLDDNDSNEKKNNSVERN